MNGVQKAIFPGLIFGMLALVGLTQLIGMPHAVLASTEEAPVIQADEFNSSLPVIYASEEQAQAAAALEPEPEPEAEPQPEPESSCSVSASFPDSVRRWCDLIDQYASQHGLESNLVAAVILQESNGNPDAYSSSGAVGLMQVMPRDGKAAGFMCVNGPCFANRPGMNELYDPEFNVDYGARMLAGLIYKRGSVRDGLFAYGPSNVGYYYADKVLGIYEAHR